MTKQHQETKKYREGWIFREDSELKSTFQNGEEKTHLYVIEKQAFKDLKADFDKLKALAVDVESDYDCDSDAHKYETSCRCCMAEQVLQEIKDWDL